MIDPKDWKWLGFAGHLIVGQWCRFHLATLVGDVLVSTVGQFVHPRKSGGSERTEFDYLADHPEGEEIGPRRHYETMAFRARGPCKVEKCGCGMPMTTGDGLGFAGYDRAADATRGHYEMCLRFAEEQEDAEYEKEQV